MVTLKGQNIYLRALEPNDLEFVYSIENDESIWEVSNTQTPYSRFLIRQYLENAHQDIYEAKQLRLAICKNQDFSAIGLIDLFDFDPKNNRAGIGILIKDSNNRNSGIGSESLDLKKTRQVHIMEPHWNDAKIRQIIGRAIRYKSHESLLLNEREVQVYRWISIFPLNVNYQTADEYLEELSKNKDELYLEFKIIIIEATKEKKKK